jgi:hypothetical protein
MASMASDKSNLYHNSRVNGGNTILLNRVDGYGSRKKSAMMAKNNGEDSDS